MPAGLNSYAWSMALTAGIVFSLAPVIVALGPERRGVVYGATPEAPPR